MKTSIKMLALTGIMMLTLVACKTVGETLVENGATPFTKSETIAYISGKTQVWSKGGAFHATDGSLDTLWSGTREVGTWSVTDEGALCWHIASWGDGACDSYYHDGGGVTTVYKGTAKPAQALHDGNILDSL